MVDTSRLKPGDVVTVRMRADFIGPSRLVVCPLDRKDINETSIPFTDILSIEERPLAVGDRVKRHVGSNIQYYGHINAISDDGKGALILTEEGNWRGDKLSDLTRLPDGGA